MDEDVLQKYIEAGRIAARVREEVSRLVRPGVRLIEICEFVEKRIEELGGKPAFPCNISINDIAAHYTPLIDDESTVPEASVVKVDVGVHVDGYIADTAITISLDPKWDPLLEAVREALEKALESVKPGVRFAETGRVIGDTIRRYGFKPIVNLSGHSLARYRVHAGESIPNTYDLFSRGKYQAGRAYAIEPFGTTGEGLVYEGDIVGIYSLIRPNLKRRLDDRQKKILNTIRERYHTLPFAERWLRDSLEDVDELRRILRKLTRMGYLAKYPILVERRKGIVAQFEHTVVITNDGEVIVTTL